MDQGGGLAVAIFVACALMIALPFVLGAWIGRKVTTNPSRRILISLTCGTLGAFIGWLAVMATFYESTFSPPLRLKLNAPANFKHEWVILLEDPASHNELKWSGFSLPFTNKQSEISVPPSGVVRVRDLSAIAGVPVDEVTADGVSPLNRGGGPAPPGVSAQIYVAFARSRIDNANVAEPDPPFSDSGAFARYIKAREAAAR